MSRFSLAAIVATFEAVATAAAQPVPASGLCQPVSDQALPDSIAPSTFVGRYVLTLVATSGRKVGQIAHGSLTLVRSDPSDLGRGPDGTAISVTHSSDGPHPAYGWTDVRLKDVGAISQWDPGSRDPIYPGVLVAVFPRRDTARQELSVYLQLGSGSRDDRAVFDAPTTMLTAKRIDGDRIAGTWSSGSLVHTGNGYFCLERERRLHGLR